MKHCNFFKIGVFTLLSLLLAVSTASSKSPFLTDIPDVFTEIFPADDYSDFEYKGLKPSCSNYPGSDPEFSFFVKGGKKNKLVIYLQGGGACWDTKNCLYAPTYLQEAPPIDMFADTSGMGIFDTANKDNPFKDWNFVFIPYCTGDIHWGANDQEYIDYGYVNMIPHVNSWTIRHRGAVNFQVVLQWIKDNFILPNQIFVTGSSAGSYGAIMSFPFIKDAYPLSSVSVIGDAGNGVTEPYFQNNSIFNWNIQMPTWIDGFEEGYTPDMTIADVYKNIANYYPYAARVGQFTTACQRQLDRERHLWLRNCTNGKRIFFLMRTWRK